jgi:hypothetical protein
MLIPAMAVPASAANGGSLALTLVDSNTRLPIAADGDGTTGWNVSGSTVMVTATLDPGYTLAGWDLFNVATAPVTSPAQFVFPTNPPGVSNPVYVAGVWGDTIIKAYVTSATGNQTLVAEKKWGQIASTVISSSPAGSTYVTWNEAAKKWSATATITDLVNGTFYEKDNAAFPHVAQGAILNWYLIPGNVSVNMTAGDANIKKAQMALLGNPTLVIFSTGGYYAQTVTGNTGSSSVTLNATGEQAVQVVVVPEYPLGAITNIPVTPEIISYAFYTTEAEVVPQVRWAGEKIVLEKYWGPTPGSAGSSFAGKWVKFSLENQSVGTLEGISGTQFNVLNGSTVWVTVDANGGAAVILTSSDTGTSSVVAGLYATPQSDSVLLGNQHYFYVYWLKFEVLTLGDVNGKRLGHSTGLWDPANPYLTATDTTTQTLNVSQDALLRARVKGWFTSSNPSVRLETRIDPANSTTANATTSTLLLPAGRWVLPDDWPALAGANWAQSRMHWDIMNTPDGSSGSYSGWSNLNIATNYYGTPAGPYAYNANSLQTPPLKAINDAGNVDGLGNYFKIKTAAAPAPPTAGIKILYGLAGPGLGNIASQYVIGPFSPGLELMTPTGWTIPNPNYDPLRSNMDNTVVPDGVLNWWDAPMPPAKIIFQIQANTDASAKAGYFKAAAKTDIYYIWLHDPLNAANSDLKVYTNPFYQEMIPAHEAIPPFINNGGYDWNSFDTSYGPYMFWEFINQNRYLPIVTSSDPSGHPTAVEVYSDNHGEAMVWLNGNWNLNLQSPKGAADIPYMTQVGQTTVQATADYPYSRLHQAINSNPDTKTFLWGGLVLGTDVHTYSNGTFSNGTATRLVLSAGTWNPNTVIGTYPYQSALSEDRVVWVFVSDRDGRLEGVNGAQVNWLLSAFTGSGAHIRNTNGSISLYNWITGNITLTGGFLSGTNGTIMDPFTGAANAVSYLIPVKSSVYLTALFNKFWGSGYTDPITGVHTAPTSLINGLDPANFAVAAIDVEDGGNQYQSTATVSISIHSPDFLLNPPVADPTLLYKTLVDFSVADPLDDGMRPGDANCDGSVNMGDVTATERMILGIDKVTSNAVLNSDGTVDMGTVVKIERTILGLK